MRVFRRKLWLIVLVVVPAAFVAARLHEGPCPPFTSGITFDTPVDTVTRSGGRAIMKHPIPSFPEGDVTVGGHEGLTLHLLRITAVRSKPSPWRVRSLDLTYTEGVTLHVDAARQFAANMYTSGYKELRPVAQVFGRSDSQTDFVNGTVRGHVAWIRARRADIPICFHSDLERRKTSSVTWVEHAEKIELTGPYGVDTLKSIAESIQFR